MSVQEPCPGANYAQTGNPIWCVFNYLANVSLKLEANERMSLNTFTFYVYDEPVSGSLYGGFLMVGHEESKSYCLERKQLRKIVELCSIFLELSLTFNYLLYSLYVVLFYFIHYIFVFLRFA